MLGPRCQPRSFMASPPCCRTVGKWDLRRAFNDDIIHETSINPWIFTLFPDSFCITFLIQCLGCSRLFISSFQVTNYYTNVCLPIYKRKFFSSPRGGRTGLLADRARPNGRDLAPQDAARGQGHVPARTPELTTSAEGSAEPLGGARWL